MSCRNMMSCGVVWVCCVMVCCIVSCRVVFVMFCSVVRVMINMMPKRFAERESGLILPRGKLQTQEALFCVFCLHAFSWLAVISFILLIYFCLFAFVLFLPKSAQLALEHQRPAFQLVGICKTATTRQRQHSLQGGASCLDVAIAVSGIVWNVRLIKKRDYLCELNCKSRTITSPATDLSSSSTVEYFTALSNGKQLYAAYRRSCPFEVD